MTRRHVAVLVSDVSDGKAAAPGCRAAVPVRCPCCYALAVLPLNETMLAKQRDETTHVCHPCLGGCNWGHRYVGPVFVVDNGAKA